MSVAEALRRNGPFVAVLFAIAVMALALVLATVSLLLRM